jgi:HlyD family secretion protein
LVLDMQSGKKVKPLAIVCALVLPVLLWFGVMQWFDSTGRSIVVSGTIQAKEIAIASRIGGKIEKLFVQEGQIVKKRQALVEFEEPELDARRKELRAAIDHAAADLLALKNGPRRSEIERAQAAAGQAFQNWQMLRRGYRHEEVDAAKNQMKQSEVELEWAHRDYLRMKALTDQGAVSNRDSDQLLTKEKAAREAYEMARENYSKVAAGPRAEEIAGAEQQYLQAKATLNLLEQGTRFEDIKRGEARLHQAQANLAAVEAQLTDRTVYSPADAEVSVMDLHEGEIIPANRTIATLTRLDMVWTRVYIPERELARVRVGQAVQVKVDAYPQKVFAGKIVQIPGVAEFTPRNVQTPEERSAQVFGLKVNIENQERTLRGGMNADVILPPVAEARDTVAREPK